MVRKWLFPVLAMLLVLCLIPSSVITSAKEGEAALGSAKMIQTFTEPVIFPHSEYISGQPWLMFTGQDPSGRLFGSEDEKESPVQGGLQAAGGAAAALIPYRSPAVNFSRNILVTRDVGALPYQTEPHIAVNPKDPNHLVAGVIDYNLQGVGSYVSIDGGATWQGPYQPQVPRGAYAGAGDPVVAFDRAGNIYMSQLSVHVDDFDLAGLMGSAVFLSISVSKSTDGGFTWDETVVAAPGKLLTFDFPLTEDERQSGELWTYALDKSWLTVGPDPDNPSEDIIYLSYTLFIDKYSLGWMGDVPVLLLAEAQSGIEVVHSKDGGQKWSEPTLVSMLTNILSVKAQVVQGSQPVTGPDGTLYVAYFDSTGDGFQEGKGEIWVAISNDRGESFSKRVLAASFLELDFLPRTAPFRIWGSSFPQVAVGPEGELYISYAPYSEDNLMDGGDVYMVRSLDKGQNWSDPVKVNDDETDRLQFYTSITADPEGVVHMMWGDTRDDPVGLSYHIYYSSSKDRGETWEFNSRVSDYPTNPNRAFPRGAFIGDYFSMTSTSEDVYMVWPDGRLGEIMGMSQKVAFARKRPIATPSIFLSPPSGAAGRDIAIRGSHFQPDSEIFIQLGGVLIAAGRTSAEGTFAMTFFLPISGEGARDVVASDISGNVAIASLFTEFGFDTFQRRLNEISEQTTDIFEQGIGNIQEQFDELRKQVAILTAEEPPVPFPWLTVVLAGALVIAMAALAALGYRLYTVSRNSN